MRAPSWLLIVLMLGPAVLLPACSGPRAVASRADLEARILRNPNDAEALRDLGVLYAIDSDYAKAAETLQRAFDRRPDDPRTLYFLGLVNEALGRAPTALRLYERYESVPASSDYREKLRGRYHWLLRDQVQRELRAALAEEETLAAVPTDDALAVLPLTFRGEDDRYAPLGRGFAEMIAVDLAAVDQLTVVERARLQALLGELELARSGRIDPATAPRYGRLLRAGRLVGGQYAVRDEQLRVDAGVYDADEAAPMSDLAEAGGALDRLFEVEKEVVEQLLETLGVTPTPAQQDRLARVPTQNGEAFLTFSRGLILEDRREYGAAAELYHRAATLDPGFTLAAEKAARCEAIDAQKGEAAGLIASATGTGTSSLVGRRSARLNGTLGQHLVPGPDTREAALEGLGGGLLGPLPDPPPPPGGDQ